MLEIKAKAMQASSRPRPGLFEAKAEVMEKKPRPNPCEAKVKAAVVFDVNEVLTLSQQAD